MTRQELGSDAMDPYQVLGVTPTATTDDIEAAYRRLLRAHHPDLHHDGPAEDLARAEQRTRELNQAIALVRAGWRPDLGAATWAAASSRSTWDGGLRVDDHTDWFGRPYAEHRTSAAVDCPLCHEAFGDATHFRVHLVQHHHLRHDTFMPSPRPHRDRLHWLTWVPMPPLTMTALLVVYLVLVVGLLPWPWTVPAIWSGIIVTGAALVKAMSGRRVY
jgi:hypothetical protein